MKILVVVLVLSAACFAAAEQDTVGNFLEYLAAIPVIRESMEFVAVSDFHKNAIRSASPQVLADCVSGAQNVSNWTPDCDSAYTRLAVFQQVFNFEGRAVNDSQINSICRSRCFQKFTLFFNSWSSCLSAASTRSEQEELSETQKAALRHKVETDRESVDAIVRSVSTTTTISSTFSGMDPNFNGGMNAVAATLGSLMQFFCLRNDAGTYCMSQTATIMQSISTSFPTAIASIGVSMAGAMNSPGSSPAMPSPGVGSGFGSGFGSGAAAAVSAPTCSALQATGCCLSAYLNVTASVISNALVATASMGQAAPTASLSAAAAQISSAINQLGAAVLQACPSVSTASCVPNAATAPRLNGAARLSIPWAWWNSQTATKQAQIKTAVCTDLAASAGFYADRCSITGVSQTTSSSRRLLTDSTAFNYQVLGSSNTNLQADQAALTAASVDYSTVAQATGLQSVSGTTTVSEIAPAPGSNNGNTVSFNVVGLLAALIAAVAYVF